MTKPNRFQALSAALKGEEEPTPDPQPTIESSPVKKGRAKGKRSNPEYEQVGAYIPKALNLQVKRVLLEEELDFSELVAQLLQAWVSSKSVK